jgi:hypothetical protein
MCLSLCGSETNVLIALSVCLPQPTVTSAEDIYRLIGLMVLIWVLMLTEAYSLRLRHVVAGFFYPRVRLNTFVKCNNMFTGGPLSS